MSAELHRDVAIHKAIEYRKELHERTIINKMVAAYKSGKWSYEQLVGWVAEISAMRSIEQEISREIRQQLD